MNWKRKIMEWFGFRSVENRHRKEWSKVDKEEVKRLRYMYNLSDEQIGKRVGRTERAVRQMRYREEIV